IAVTESPNIGHVGLQLIVDDDVAALVGLHSGAVQAQVAGVGDAPNREKHVSPQYFERRVFTVDAHDDCVIALREGNAFRVEPNLDLFFLENFADGLRDVFVLLLNQARTHLNNSDFAAEAAVHLGELEANVTAADYDEVRRQEIHAHHG